MTVTDPKSLPVDEARPIVPPGLFRTQSLVDHMRVCHDLVSRADVDASLLAWVFVYLRLFRSSGARHEMRSNYQSKDIAHIQDVFSLALSKAYADTHSRGSRGSDDGPFERALIRGIAASVPRGGGNGDELRLFILDMMRRHGIREGHRPGIDDPFLEAWHQKLHSCSTSEDIAICEAYIAFQRTGSHDQFFRVLWDRGHLTAENLRSMPRPLVHLPRHMPKLVADLGHLLWILKQIHAGSEDLHYLIEVSRWQLDADTLSLLEGIRDNWGAWWVPGKVIQVRKKLMPRLRSGSPRDPLMLDVALDGVFKSSIERLDLQAMDGDDLMTLAGLALENVGLSYERESVGPCLALWERVRSSPRSDRWTRPWSLRAFAALSSLHLFAQACSDEFFQAWQPRAEALAAKLGVATSYGETLAEEAIRSQGVYCLSKLIDALTPRVRQAAGVRPWRIVSRGEIVVRGSVTVADSLRSAGKREAPASPHERRIVVVDGIDGTEDLPKWVGAVITRAEVDLLSHVAIRARAGGILLATCYDERELADIRRRPRLRLRVDDVSLTYVDDECHDEGDDTRNVGEVNKDTDPGRRWPSPSGPESPGSKSGNLALLAARLPDRVKLPLGVALPPDLFDRSLEDAPGVLAEIRRLESSLGCDARRDGALLRELRESIARMPLSEPIITSIRAHLNQPDVFAIASRDLLDGDAVCRTVKRVWASVWNERAHASRLARGVPRESVRLGVLVQKAIPADYAFVVHTRHPVSDDPREMLVEVVVGLGETLAGNAPGAPFRAVVRRDTRTHVIESYPSKAFARVDSTNGSTLMVRSDFSDEDRRGFSGAGLYDSFLVHPPRLACVSYAGERLFWDEAFQCGLCERILATAEAVEAVMKVPQDIEGVISGGEIYVVQTRDQSDLAHARVDGHAFGRAPLDARAAVS